MEGGLIAAIVIGSLVGVLLLWVIVWKLRIRRSVPKEDPHEEFLVKADTNTSMTEMETQTSTELTENRGWMNKPSWLEKEEGEEKSRAYPGRRHRRKHKNRAK